MIEVLINAVFPGADIKLAAPWNVLNSVPLGGFEFVVKFSPDDSSPQKAGLTKKPNINLGFARIDDIALEYDVKTEKVIFRITKVEFLGKEIGPENPLEWDVAESGDDAGSARQGSELFRLDFLGMGQHMGVRSKKRMARWCPFPLQSFGAIAQLTEAFKGDENLQLVFNEASDWLIATRFTVLQAVDMGIVFYDPELYGLMISVTGGKAKEKLPIFNGLVFEILYKKINDTVGMWQIDLTLPLLHSQPPIRRCIRDLAEHEAADLYERRFHGRPGLPCQQRLHALVLGPGVAFRRIGRRVLRQAQQCHD